MVDFALVVVTFCFDLFFFPLVWLITWIRRFSVPFLTLIHTCSDSIGTKTKRNQDRFYDIDERLQQLITKKRQTFIKLQNGQQSATKRRLYSQEKTEDQKTTRNLKNQWRGEKKNAEIQQLADAYDTRSFFNATKNIFSPRAYAQPPLKVKMNQKY